MPMTKARPAAARRRSSWTPAATNAKDGEKYIFVKPTLQHFLEFAPKLRLDNGKPFVVEDWQAKVLTDYFDGVTETLLLLPSGNGKTTLLAAIALHHLLYTENPEAFIMASSRDQAGRMHAHIVGFIDRSKALQQLVRPLRRSVELIHRKGSIEVCAADADTVDGIGPTLAIIDELHRHKTTDLYVVALKGLKKRNGQIFHCSTAGETEESPLGELRKRCQEIAGLAREGMYSYARSADGTLAYHEFALDITDDADDMEVVKLANPLSSITIEHLAAEHKAMKWWDWARFACGLWVAGQHAAISPIDWAAVNYETVDFDPDAGYQLAVDLAWKKDTTAITAVQALSRLDVRAKLVEIVVPPGDRTLREAEILSPIEDWITLHPGCTGIVIDPEAGGRSLIEKFEELGLEVTEHSQKNEPMCHAYGQMDGIIRQRIDEDDPDGPRVLRVEHDRRLTRQVLAAEAKVIVGEASKLVKRRKNPEPIDAAVSLAMNVNVALAELDDEPVDRSLYRMEFLD